MAVLVEKGIKVPFKNKTKQGRHFGVKKKNEINKNNMSSKGLLE